jgi:hypothetical protein
VVELIAAMTIWNGLTARREFGEHVIRRLSKEDDAYRRDPDVSASRVS